MKKTIVTHSATFHADDVFAVAAYIMAHGGRDAWNIVRTRDEEIIKHAEAVVDVGGEYDHARNRYDHHQVGGAGIREDGTPYAAFGLVWKHFGEQLCGNAEIAASIEQSLVKANDATDNGVEVATLLFEDVREFSIASYVAVLNPTWKEEDAAEDADALRDERFTALVDWAMHVLSRMILRAKHKYEACAEVEAMYQASSDKRVIVMERFYPWHDVLLAHPEPVFVVGPSLEAGRWAVRAVPAGEATFDTRMRFPEAWGGLRDAELSAVTGVPDAVFCHTKLFLAVAGSREGALALAYGALGEQPPAQT